MAKRKAGTFFLTTIIILAVILIILILMFFSKKEEEHSIELNLDNGLQIISIGSYSGEYLEDGSNDKVKDILMIKVENTSDKVLQYTELTLENQSGDKAVFALSTLPSNTTMTVLEANRKEYKKDIVFTAAEAKNTVFFDDGISLYADRLKIGGMEGAFNVQNISNEDITGTIYLYYKNYEDNLLKGGITYRAKIEDGIAAGEIKQIMTKHFSPEKSILMFVTIGE